MDEQKLASEGLDHLKALVSFDTSNPPGNELPAARYLEKVLRAEGFDPVVIESAPQRGNVVARLSGDGTEQPLLLMSHLDVVPVDAERWDFPPFAAQENDGYLYGRGTLDMKQMTAMSLMALLTLKRKKIPLKRDVIFAAVADEEAGGKYGAGYMVEHHPDLIQAEYALSELGGFMMDVRGKHFYTVQVAERGLAWCRVKFQGDAGHGSIPDPQSAISKMVRALQRLEKKGLPHRCTDVVRDFVEVISHGQKTRVRATLKALLKPMTSRMAMGRLEEEQARFFNALLHSTATATVIHAGEEPNVIPSQAEVVLDGRVLPGQSWEEFEADLKKVLGKEAEIELIRWMDPLVYSADTPLFDVIRRVVVDREPVAQVVPYLLTAYTDAKHLDKLGIVTYGFSPMKNDPQEKITKLIHGHNERIGIQAFSWGQEVLAEVVERFCSVSSASGVVDSLMDELLDSPPIVQSKDKTNPDGLAAGNFSGEQEDI